MVAKLAALRDCKTFVVANLSGLAGGLVTPAQIREFIEEVNRACNAIITDYRIGHDPDDPAPATRGPAIRRPQAGMVADLLDAHGLSPSAAVMIGASDKARQRAEAARLARFVWAGDYFGAA